MSPWKLLQINHYLSEAVKNSRFGSTLPVLSLPTPKERLHHSWIYFHSLTQERSSKLLDSNCFNHNRSNHTDSWTMSISRRSQSPPQVKRSPSPSRRSLSDTCPTVPKITRIRLISCGSFNPITIAHLRMFELAKDHYEKNLSTRDHRYVIEKGIFSPTNDKYGEKRNILKASERITMIDLGIKSSHVTNWISIDDWETKEEDWVPTLRSLRHQLEKMTEEYKNDLNDVPGLRLLCGADLIQSFAKPGLWKTEHLEEIVSKFGLVVISRIGSDARKFIHEHEILKKNLIHIQLINEPVPNEISSTIIRQQIKEGRSIKYFVPDGVIEYIEKNNLYK